MPSLADASGTMAEREGAGLTPRVGVNPTPHRAVSRAPARNGHRRRVRSPFSVPRREAPRTGHAQATRLIDPATIGQPCPPSPTYAVAQSAYPFDRSTPMTSLGAQRSSTALVSAPVPQATSNQRGPGGTASHSRNRGATSKADWLAAGLPTERAAPVSLRAADVVDGAVPVCAPDDLVRTAAAQARDVGWDTGIVVNDGGVVLGRLHLDRVDPSLDVPVEEVLEPGRPPCAPTPRSTPPWRGCGTEASPPSW